MIRDIDDLRNVPAEELKGSPMYYAYSAGDIIGGVSDVLKNIRRVTAPDFDWLSKYILQLDDMYEEIDKALCALAEKTISEIDRECRQ